MNLYIVSQSSNNDWDTYDSAIVAAENANAARCTHPSGDNKDWNDKYMSCWVDNPGKVTVRLIGTTDLNAGLVLASFNAG